MEYFSTKPLVLFSSSRSKSWTTLGSVRRVAKRKWEKQVRCFLLFPVFFCFILVSLYFAFTFLCVCKRSAYTFYLYVHSHYCVIARTCACVRAYVYEDKGKWESATYLCWCNLAILDIVMWTLLFARWGLRYRAHCLCSCCVAKCM